MNELNIKQTVPIEELLKLADSVITLKQALEVNMIDKSSLTNYLN